MMAWAPFAYPGARTRGVTWSQRAELAFGRCKARARQDVEADGGGRGAPEVTAQLDHEDKHVRQLHDHQVF